MTEAPFWKTKPLTAMTEAEWESLCDGCGKCCTNTLEDEETGDLYATRVACRLFCDKTAQCSNYAERVKHVPECIKVSPENVAELDFLPATCGYRLVWQGADLPDWHHLVCGDREEIHRRSFSVRGRTVNEAKLGKRELEDFLHDWDEDPRFAAYRPARWQRSAK
jgi:hypothetical protein